MRVAELEKAVAAAEAQQKDLQKEIADLADENKKQHSQLVAQKAETLEKEKDAEDAREMVARLREARDGACLEAEHAAEMVARLQEQLKKTDAVVEERRQALSAAQARSVALEKEAVEEQTKLQGKMRDAHSQLDAAQVRIKVLEEQATCAAEATQHAKRELAEGHRRYAALEGTLANVNGALAQRGKEVAQVQAAMSKIKEEAEALAADRENEKARARAAAAQVGKIERCLAEQRLEAQGWRAKASDLDLALRRAQTREEQAVSGAMDVKVSPCVW